jgi:hypothetical protein
MIFNVELLIWLSELFQMHAWSRVKGFRCILKNEIPSIFIYLFKIDFISARLYSRGVPSIFTFDSSINKHMIMSGNFY